MAVLGSFPRSGDRLFDPASWKRLAANPATGVVILIVATALSGFRVDVASLGLRAEHIALAIVGGFWAWQALRGKWRLALARSDLLLLLFVGIALAASVLYAPSTRESLQYLAIMVLCLGIYLLVRGLVTDSTTFRTTVLALIVVVAFEALLGVVTWLLYPLGIDWRVQLYQLGAGRDFTVCSFSPQGTLVESNIYGSYVMGGALLAAPLLLGASDGGRRRWLMIALAGMLAAVGLSLTRSVWVALAIGLAAVVVVSSGQRRRAVLTLAPMAVLAVGVILLASNVLLPCKLSISDDGTLSLNPTVSSAGEGPGVTSRITQTYTFSGRFSAYQEAISDWLKHPLIGNGPNSYGQIHTDSSNKPAWISNVVVMSLNDTGLFGSLALLAWFAWLAFRFARAMLRAPPGFTRTALLALAIALMGLFIAYQLTTALWLGFTWVYLALLDAGTAILLHEIRTRREAAPGILLKTVVQPAPARELELR